MARRRVKTRAPRPRVPRPPRRPRVRRRPRPRRTATLLSLLALALAFALGRWTAPTPPPPEAPLSESEPTRTATVARRLCPCPEPKTPPPTRSLPRRPVRPRPPELAPRPDPTAATGAALREAAKSLGRCAPATGPRRPLHLEVTVRPSGEVQGLRVLNVDHLPPPEVVRCVRSRVSALELPGFDATEPARFSLSLSL